MVGSQERVNLILKLGLQVHSFRSQSVSKKSLLSTYCILRTISGINAWNDSYKYSWCYCDKIDKILFVLRDNEDSKQVTI
jgi:hypothetical protein